MCLNVLYACKYVHVLHMRLLLKKVRKVSRPPGPGVTDDCEAPCECWEQNPTPGQEKQLLNKSYLLPQGLSAILRLPSSTRQVDYQVSCLHLFRVEFHT